MEEVENVSYISPPFATTEEEIATTFILEEPVSTDQPEEMITENSTVPENVVNNTSNENFTVPFDTNVVAEVNVDKYTCAYCLKKFSKPSNKQRHVRKAHKIKINKSSCIKCIECNETFPQVYRLRDHLQEKHGLHMEEQEFRFPNMDAFRKWKCEIERKTLSSFTLRHGARTYNANGPRYFYACHRSGRYAPKLHGRPRQRMIKTQGSCKLGIICTASIVCHENQDHVYVRYCPNHYGHGSETTLIQLSPEEQTAISESVSKGATFENLLDEIRDGQSTKDHFQLHLLKKKDMRIINSAYECEEFNTGLSDAESVDAWVQLCCQIENSPILFYKKEEFVNEQEEFILIIMTEFQKQILLGASKDVVCVDSLYRRKGGRFYLTVLFIIDDNNLAFPVAFCISNKVDKNVIFQFYHSICQSTGPLSFTYFMSDSEAFYYEAWKEVMNDESKWLWSLWYVDSRVRVQLRIFKGNTARRAHVYKNMRMLLECQNQTIFKCMFENFINGLLDDPESRYLGNFIQKHYGSNPEIWAYCYRKDLDLAINIHLEIVHRTFRYCCRLGRKRRLDTFIFVLMKLVRYKMLDRIANSADEEKIGLAIETINDCHSMGLEIDPDCITALTENTWVIKSDTEEGNVYILRETKTCPEHCSLKCTECDICVHNFSCSCTHSLINANLCEHIHAVVWNFLTPHFSPAPSPVHFDSNEIEITSVSSVGKDCSDLLQSVLRRTHDVYKMIQLSKWNLSKPSLLSILKRMDECFDICSGKKVEEEKPKQPVPTTISNNSNTVLLLNSVPKQNSQPLILNSQFPTILPNNGPSQYVLLVPSTNKPQ